MKINKVTEKTLVDFIWSFNRQYKKKPTGIILHPEYKRTLHDLECICRKECRSTIMINVRPFEIVIMGIPVIFTTEIPTGTVYAIEHLFRTTKSHYRNTSGEIRQAIVINGYFYGLPDAVYSINHTNAT